MPLWPRRSATSTAASTPAADLAGAIERIDDLVAVVSASGETIWCNPAAAGLLVRRGDEAPLPVHEVVLGGAKRSTQLSWHVADGSTWQSEETLLTPGGSELPVCLTVVPRMDADGAPDRYVVFARDLRPDRAKDAAAARRALHDELTGVANPTLLGSRLDLALARLRTLGSPDDPFWHHDHRSGTGHDGARTAFVLLDIDGLRVVNESLGRDAGDALLREVADRLVDGVRATDTVGRFKGSEFAVIAQDRADLRSTSSLCQDLLTRVRKPFPFRGATVIPKASIGVVHMAGSDTLAGVLRRADLALGQAKYAGGDTIVVDDGGLLLSTDADRRLDAALRGSFTGTTIPLHFQPAVDLRTGSPVFAEALLRVTHPSVGRISPGDVVSAAAGMGCLGELARMTLYGAMAEAVRWEADVAVAVNLSAQQLHDENLPGLVETALASTGIAPRRLVLEVTESAFLVDQDLTVTALHTLRGLGVRTALDGLGADWPALSTLRTLPVDIIKVDQALLGEAQGSARACAVLGAVLGIAEVLGIAAVAGRIETEEQLECAGTFGFQLGQGHRIAQPAAATDLDPWLAPQPDAPHALRL